MLPGCRDTQILSLCICNFRCDCQKRDWNTGQKIFTRGYFYCHNLASLHATDDNTWCMPLPTLGTCHHQLPSPCAIGDSIWLIRPLDAVTGACTWRVLLPTVNTWLMPLPTAITSCNWWQHLVGATANTWRVLLPAANTWHVLLPTAVTSCNRWQQLVHAAASTWCMLSWLYATDDKTWCLPLPTLGACCHCFVQPMTTLGWCHCQHLMHVFTIAACNCNLHFEMHESPACWTNSSDEKLPKFTYVNARVTCVLNDLWRQESAKISVWTHT